MKIVQAPRASAILYHLLCSQPEKRTWLLPANICPIVPITFLKAGVPFEWVDISATTLHMDLDQAEARIRMRTYGGLLYAHTYGDVSTPDDFFSTIKRLAPELLLVDDRCLCVPELDALPRVTDVQLYSTGYAKIVELNYGGYAFLDEQVRYEARHLRFDPAAHDEIERSYKESIRWRTPYIYRDSDWLETETTLPDWQPYSDEIRSKLASSLEHRGHINQVYRERLPVELQLPEPYQSWRFNIRLNHRDPVLAAIFAKGLFASAHYASLAGIIGEGTVPHAVALADEVINLFNDHHFSLAQAEEVCAVILEYRS